METAEKKNRLRATLREAQERLTEMERVSGDRVLAERFLALEDVRASRTVLLYCSMGAEPDTWVLLERLIGQGKRVALPRCLSGRRMETREYLPGLPLIRHRLGMLEPGEEHPFIDPGEIDLALVPALAYDRDCMRIGQGGGYYDRFLARFSGKTVGLCRDRMLRERIPCEAHDRPVDLVLTETGLFLRAGGQWTQM